MAQSVSYNEPDNVTCAMCGWAHGSPWYYLWQRRPNSSTPSLSPHPRAPTTTAPGPLSNVAPPPPPCGAPEVIGKNIDITGGDIGPIQSASVAACTAACCAKANCAGFLFEQSSDAQTQACKRGKPCCWLKSSINPSHATKPPSVGAIAVRISGRKPPPPPPPRPPLPPQPTLDEVMAPPFGYRSSPALGGVSTGSTELRSDGSFREWCVHCPVLYYSVCA